MSQEQGTPDLLELTRRVYASLNGRDFDAVIGMFGPTSTWDVSRWGLGTHAGVEKIGRFLKDWFGSLDEYEVQVEEMHDLGKGIVLAVVTQIARQAGSRSVLRVRSAPVFAWAEGKIALVTLYPNIEEGRAAARRAAEPSSQRNIHLHDRLLDAVSAGEVPEDLLAADFFIEIRATPATDYKYHGAAGLLEWRSDLFEAFAEEPDYRVEEVVAATDDCVAATLSVAGRGVSSSEPLQLRWASVTWFRDGRAARAVGYPGRGEALKAAGLAE